MTEILKACGKLHRQKKNKKKNGDTRSCWAVSHITLLLFSPINYPRFSLITWTSWQDVPARIHPPTRPCILHAFWRTRAVHLAGREIEHLFFMEEIEREWACVKRRQVCVCVCACGSASPCDRDAFVWERRWQTTDQRSWGAVTNACVEWLTAPNVSLLLISRIFSDKSHLSHLKKKKKSGSAAECRIYKVVV